MQTEEGRVFPYSGDTTNYYEYYLAYHLGNNRIAFDNPGGAGATVEQQDNYLPFGLEISQYVNIPKNEYLYNGKELQEGFQLYDYGARFYDPVIGRWHVVDAYAEHPDQVDLSPYAYVGNNPIDKTDPDGNCPPCGVSAPVEVTFGTVFGGSLAVAGTMEAGGIVTGPGEAVVTVGAVVVVAAGAIAGGVVALWHALTPSSNNSSVNSSTGNDDSPHPTSNAARKDAMRKEGIPTSQQPTAQKKSAAGNTLTYDVPKTGGGTQKKQVQDQKLDENHGPHWEAGKPKADGQKDPSGRPRMQNGKSKSYYTRNGNG